MQTVLSKLIRSIRVGMVKRLYRPRLSVPTGEEAALIEELRRRFRAFEPVDAEPHSEAEKAWAKNASRLHTLVLSDDPRAFLRWDVITETMSVSNEYFLDEEFSSLRQSPEWNDKWKPALREVPTGNPIPFVYYPKTSGNCIHHAYHLQRLGGVTGYSVDDFDTILEFGGGYGGMCRLAHNLGFGGRYIIYDLPQFSALQEYYLRSLKLPVGTEKNPLETEKGILCLSDIGRMEQSLNRAAADRRTLFIATWSLSEAPIPVRDRVEPFVSTCDAYLMAYQDQFQTIDNRDYFSSWEKRLGGGIEWWDRPIDHLPGNNYLIGTRRHEKVS